MNPLGQFFIMQLIDRFKSTKLIAWGLVISIISFAGMAMVTFFWLMVIPWVILSFAWGFLYVGCLKFVMERNIEKATSTGILNSSMHISRIIGAFMGGIIAFNFGRLANIYTAALMSSIGLILFFVLLRIVDKKQRNEHNNVNL